MVLSTIPYISLFTGGTAGLDLGLELAVPRSFPICYVENEVTAAERVVQNIEAGHLAPAPLWTDVKTFDGTKLCGKVLGIIGGFPCTDVSLAGDRAGVHGERSGLWWHYARIIREVRPCFVFVENVLGLLYQTKDKETGERHEAGIGTVLDDLAQIGMYAEWCVISVRDVGGSMLRRRVFIFGWDPDQCRRLLHHDRGQLAQSGRQGLEGRKQDHVPRGSCRSGPSSSTGELRKPPVAPGDALGDTNHTRQQQPARDNEEGRGRTPYPDTEMVPGDLGPSFPIHPPRPGAFDAWAAVDRSLWPITHQPTLQGMVDGSSDPVDRHRFIGNGVHPLEAGYAFRTLSTRAGLGGLFFDE